MAQSNFPALTVQQVQTAYLAFFNRPADSAGLAYWTSDQHKGGLPGMWSSFGLVPEFTATFGNKPATEIVETFYVNMFGRPSDAAGKTYWLAELSAGRVDIGNLAAAFDAGAAPADKTILSGKVVANTATTQAAIDAVLPGTTFLLTTGVDKGATFTGTNKADVFTASLLTANDGDELNGGLGADVLNLETASNITDNFKTTSIETVNLTAFGAATVNTKGMVGLTALNSNNATGAVTLDNVASAATVFGIKGAAVNNLTINHATGALNGTADKLVVSLNTSSATTIDADSGFESVEVNTTGASTLTSLVAPNATSLTLGGNATLTLVAGAVNTFADYTVTNTAKVTYNGITTVKTFIATANTGGIVGSAKNTDATLLTNGTTTAVLALSTNGSLVETGSGDDNINVDTSALLSSQSALIRLGGGSDTLFLTTGTSAVNVFAGDGDDTIFVATALASPSLINGGAGVDTVNFDVGTHALIAQGIEKVGVLGATTVNFVAIDSAIGITDKGAAAVAFSNLKNGTTYTSTLAKTALVTLGFAAAEKATVKVDLTKGSSSGVTTTNAENVTVALGAASVLAAKIIVDSAATSLTINATGALTGGQDIDAAANTASGEKLQSVTITGNSTILMGAITNDKALTFVSAKSTGGAVTLGAIGADNTEADVTVTKIEAISSKGAAVIGNIDFSGAGTTTTGVITEITASGTGGADVATTIGGIIADKLGTVTATSSVSDATIGVVTVGADTAADFTDGTITALKASGLKAATITSVTADVVGSIVIESTDTVGAGGLATVGAIGNATATKLTMGTIDVSSKKAAATITGAISATQLGNVTITGATDATTNTITVANDAGLSTTANVSVLAGSGAATVGAIAVEVAGTITARSTAAGVVVGNMTFKDAGGVDIALTAGTAISAGAGVTIHNQKGDITLIAKAGTTYGAANAINVTGGTQTTSTTDIDVSVDLSGVTGVVSSTTVTNEGTDAASSTIVKGGVAANTIVIDGATDASSQVISYFGQNAVDNVTLTGNYATSTIRLEGGDDVFVGGAGADTVFGGAGDDSITGGAGNDILAGGEGADILIGGLGADILTGGAGADSFTFAFLDSTFATTDTITDYTTGVDFIKLGAQLVLNANTDAAGEATISAVGRVTGFNGAASTFETLTQKLAQIDLANGGVNLNAVVFIHNSSTFLYVSNGTNTANDGTDLVVLLTGVTAATGITLTNTDISAIA